MSQVAFHRANAARLAGWAVGAEDGAEGGGFNGVAQSGTCAVGFDVLHLMGGNAGIGVSSA